jgi:hypothetical protein
MATAMPARIHYIHALQTIEATDGGCHDTTRGGHSGRGPHQTTTTLYLYYCRTQETSRAPEDTRTRGTGGDKGGSKRHQKDRRAHGGCKKHQEGRRVNTGGSERAARP